MQHQHLVAAGRARQEIEVRNRRIRIGGLCHRAVAMHEACVGQVHIVTRLRDRRVVFLLIGTGHRQRTGSLRDEGATVEQRQRFPERHILRRERKVSLRGLDVEGDRRSVLADGNDDTVLRRNRTRRCSGAGPPPGRGIVAAPGGRRVASCQVVPSIASVPENRQPCKLRMSAPVAVMEPSQVAAALSPVPNRTRNDSTRGDAVCGGV